MFLIINLHQVLHHDSVTQNVSLLVRKGWFYQETLVVDLQTKNVSISTQQNDLVYVVWLTHCTVWVWLAYDFDHHSNKSHFIALLVVPYPVTHVCLWLKCTFILSTKDFESID